ncbi:hypothetical protein PUNSTDRAFT_54979, partial [Punctularia strigosozonata HHB-11173 SS5]|uniref:uncharacterized protein n=1 Tax=Punctularia strigosozonata (strain HHB-11173) TaxID=741275 RepID=UPI00044177CC
MNYAAHVGEDAAHRCALHLDKVPNGTIQLCHIIPRAEHANNLQMLERAWQLPQGSFNQDTRWAQIYLCSNYHWGFDHGGWSFLPDSHVLSGILKGINGNPKFTGQDTYKYWISEVQRLRQLGTPPEYFFIPLQTLDDRISIGRLNLANPIVDGHHKYDYINAPYDEITISLPLHPFPVIAHFMKSWQMLTAERQMSIKGRLTAVQEMLIIAA